MTVKISDLTSLGVPPQNTSILPIVETGSTLKVTIEELAQAVATYIEDNGLVNLSVSNSGIKLDNTSVAGTIRYNGANFIGYDGLSWKYLDVQTVTSPYTKTPIPIEIDGAVGIDPSKTVVNILGLGTLPISINANPQISSGTDGQLLILIGSDDTGTVQINDGNGVSLSGGIEMVLGLNSTIQLVYNSPTNTWIEISRKA